MTSKEALLELIIEQQRLISEVEDRDGFKTANEIMELSKKITDELNVLEILKDRKPLIIQFISEHTYEEYCNVFSDDIAFYSEDEFNLIKKVFAIN